MIEHSSYDSGSGDGFQSPSIEYSADPTTLLEQIIPFRFLPRERRTHLAFQLVPRHFSPGEVIMHQGDESDRTVYLMYSGTVDVFDRRAGHSTGTLIEAGHYFGEWEPLFEEARVYEIHALDEVDCFAMTEEQFLALLDGAPAFRQAFGIILRDKQGIFVPFDR
ncbi:MAG TPA: cyclic nucleotide-binding domain-containing protein, partial [candidate division Zixibacteria bacterium]|nr:cyclic nucleotide-binding domain-containing protein [candidate division Zixibacteria bacterium]